MYTNKKPFHDLNKCIFSPFHTFKPNFQSHFFFLAFIKHSLSPDLVFHSHFSPIYKRKFLTTKGRKNMVDLDKFHHSTNFHKYFPIICFSSFHHTCSFLSWWILTNFTISPISINSFQFFSPHLFISCFSSLSSTSPERLCFLVRL